MIKYQNISCHPLTFYGETFNPNEIKAVPGFINHPKMIRVKESVVSHPKAIIEVAKGTQEVKEQKVEKPQQTKRTYNRKKSNL